MEFLKRKTRVLVHTKVVGVTIYIDILKIMTKFRYVVLILLLMNFSSFASSKK